MPVILIFLLLVSCGYQAEYAGANPGGWEADLRDIAMEYAADAAEYDLPPSKLGRLHVLRRSDQKVAEAESPEEPLAGVCMIWSGRRGRQFRGEIYIKSDISGEMLKRLVYHELTHCVYEQDHFGEEGEIMYPRLSGALPWEEAKRKLFESLQVRLRGRRGGP